MVRGRLAQDIEDDATFERLGAGENPFDFDGWVDQRRNMQTRTVTNIYKSVYAISVLQYLTPRPRKTGFRTH